MTRNVSIVTDLEGRKIVLIHDVRFKGLGKCGAVFKRVCWGIF